MFARSIHVAMRRAVCPHPVARWSACSRAFSGATNDLVLVEKKASAIAVITLNRPKSLNALNDALVGAIIEALRDADADPGIRAAVLTGSGKAFAAGADIKEMGSRVTYADVRRENMLVHWNEVANIRLPVIAAVNGFALGGGCELAMACDIIIASEKAKFGQPEIKLGTIPGCGGTQRLIKAVGKSKAMELILTGDMINAAQAEKYGLVAAVHPADELVPEAVRMAEKIAAYSAPVVQLCKECVNAAEELSLSDGLKYEKGLFHATWGLEDRREGFSAFVEKREPSWKHA